jgi:hypothetical protein
MSPPPKLKIKLPQGNSVEYIYELEEARHVLDFSQGVFIIEGQSVNSYDELLNIASQDHFKDKEYLEVEWLHMVGGG